ncbi:MAG: hypothetical protein Q7S43_00335 [bacterium]|nr:hypothetical protein [bacterium]
MEQLYHPKNNIKVYVWIALVVASLLVAINGYLYFLRLSYLQQEFYAHQERDWTIQELRAQRVDISDWKMYTNEQYGFEFLYPQSFKLVTRLSDADPYVYLEETDRESIGTEGRGSSILFVIHSSPSIRNLDDYFEQMKLKPFSEDMMPGLMVGETISNVSKSMFNNYQAILYNQSYFASSLKNILIWKDNIVYEISTSLFGTKFGDGKLHDQILSTFKFTK